MSSKSSHARVALSSLLIFAALCLAGAAFAGGRAPKNEVTRAEYYVEKLEKKVTRMRGQPFKLGYEDKEALKRVKALAEKYPGDPDVEALVERTRVALVASKGKSTEIDEKMLEYRKNGDKLRKVFADEAKEELKGYLTKIRKAGAVERALPVPDPMKTDVDTMKGKYVVLEGVEYPNNEFSNQGGQYVFVGSGARGYYYIQLSSRKWLGAYEALRRYRIELGVEIPQEQKWQVIGKVTGATLLVPQAGKKKTVAAQLGWLVEPEAIYVPGYTLAIADDSDVGGAFAGERRVDEVKQKMYTVRSVPKDASPEQVVEIFATAIKERNYDLYLECIDPARRKGPKSGSQLKYHWEWHQKRFAELYVHVVPSKAKIKVLKGYDAAASDEDFFLTEADKKHVKKISDDLVEEASLTTQAYDERGRQYGSPKPRYLKRVSKGRWYITNYKQPF